MPWGACVSRNYIIFVFENIVNTSIFSNYLSSTTSLFASLENSFEYANTRKFDKIVETGSKASVSALKNVNFPVGPNHIIIETL